AILLKSSYEQWLDLSECRPRHGMGDQKIAAEIVRHRQWLAPNTVAGPEPALEISRPAVVGMQRLEQNRAPPCRAWPMLSRRHQAFAHQQISHRARRRPHLIRVVHR